MTVVTTYKDGRFLSRIAIATQTQTAAASAPFNTTVPEMRVAEYLIKLQLQHQEVTLGIVSIIGTPALVKNVVGITLGFGASASVTGEIIVSGY